MDFKLFKTREDKLRYKLSKTLKNDENVDSIVDVFKSFEDDNLKTITKLKKDKLLVSNRINGALKQTIKAHGPITLNLISSATKRILGSLLIGEKDNNYVKIHKSDLYFGCIIIAIFIILNVCLR